MRIAIILYFALSCALLFSCKPENNTDGAPDETNPAEQPEMPYAGMIDEAAKLKGLWLSESFLSSVEKHKSIYKSRIIETMVFGFEIKNDSTSANKLLFNGFSTHEGGYDGILAYHPEKKHFVHLSSGEDHEALKQSFSLSITSKNNLQLDYEDHKKEDYRRISDIDNILRLILFEGTYTDKSTGNTVIFNQNGNMEGIDDKGFYVLLYAFDGGYEFDTVFLSLNDKLESFDRYHFKIKGNTISLYSILEDENEQLSIGELIHKLVKK